VESEDTGSYVKYSTTVFVEWEYVNGELIVIELPEREEINKLVSTFPLLSVTCK